jgi:hypothetical protein
MMTHSDLRRQLRAALLDDQTWVVLTNRIKVAEALQRLVSLGDGVCHGCCHHVSNPSNGSGGWAGDIWYYVIPRSLFSKRALVGVLRPWLKDGPEMDGERLICLAARQEDREGFASFLGVIADIKWCGEESRVRLYE